MAERKNPNAPRATAASRRAAQRLRNAESAARTQKDEEDAIEDVEEALEEETEAVEALEAALEDEEDAEEEIEDAVDDETEAAEKLEEAIEAEDAAAASSKRKPSKRRRRRGKRLESDFYKLLKLCKEMNGDSSDITDAVSSSLMLTMGSVPSFSIGESMISASQAQGQMLVNSVANQQRTNIVGMVATIGSVAQMLDMRPDRFWQDDEDEDDELL